MKNRGLIWLGMTGVILGVSGWGEAETLSANPPLEKIPLPKIVKTSGRLSERLLDSSKVMEILTQEQIRGGGSFMIAELLREVPGVFLQKTTYGHGTAIIRGFIGRENLMLVDGVRLNNSTFRSGPLQYFNTIGLNDLGRLEVVRGPGSVLYGSDAMGGVINAFTPPIRWAQPFIWGLASQARSQDGGVLEHAEVEGITGSWGLQASGTYKRFGDVRAGGTLGVERPTGFSEMNGQIKVEHRLDLDQSLTFLYQWVRQLEVPRYDKYLGAREFGTTTHQQFTYDPQIRHLGYVRWDSQEPGWWWDEMVATLSWQRQRENTQELKIGSAKRSEFEDSVDTIGASLQWGSSPDPAHRIVGGVEYFRDGVASRSWEYNLATNVRIEKSDASTLPDGSSYATVAGYLQDRWRVGGGWQILPGIRYSRFSYATTLRNPPLTGGFEDAFQDLTGSLEGVLALAPTMSVIAQLSQGFRAPNLDDLVALRTTNQGVDVPSSGLRPEKALNYEFGIRGEQEDAHWYAFLFYTALTDKIDRIRGTWQGLSFIDANQNGVQDAGELPVFQKFNVGRSEIYGVELSGRTAWGLPSGWSVFGDLAWTFGQNLTDGEPLTRMPPPFGHLGIRYESHEGWVQMDSRFAGRQDRLSSRDRTDPRIDPNGTAGWMTLNVRGEIKVPGVGTFSAGVENVLDISYREHGSGVDGPGWNVYLGVRLP